jgi:NADH-quinone oxidoreductase subunit C
MSHEELFSDIPVLRLEQSVSPRNGAVLTAHLAPAELRKMAGRLLEQEFFIEDVSVLEVTEGYLAVYHFDHFERPGRIVLRLLAPHDQPVFPTISDIFQGASWHERECRDFFGVDFTDHDNLIPLLLPPEAAIHPLRKDDADRKGIAEILEPGEVLREDPGFSLFAEKAAETPSTESEAT